MTDEQIKQNAEKYADQFVSRCFCGEWKDVVLNFTAGAHSLDNEIYDLKQDIEGLQKMVKMRSDAFECALKEIDRLSNPWISVEDRLPEGDADNISIPVVARTNRGYWFKGQYDHNNKDWFFSEDPDHLDFEEDEFVTHWMSIFDIH